VTACSFVYDIFKVERKEIAMKYERIMSVPEILWNLGEKRGGKRGMVSTSVMKRKLGMRGVMEMARG
jgi:hypothetical protein